MRSQESAEHARFRLSPQQRWIALSLVAVLFLLWAVPVVGFVRMRQRVRQAETQAAMIHSKFRADGRFDLVDVTYELNGTLWIVGRVTSASDLEALQMVVDSTNPAMDVRWKVELE